jgi:hypothetical protein
MSRPRRPHHRLRNRIAAASLAVGTSSAASSFARIPGDTLVELVRAAEGDDLDDEHRFAALGALSQDERPSLRARAAAAMHVGRVSPGEASVLLAGLARDPEEEVRSAAAEGLAGLLATAHPFARVELVCSWTVAPHPLERKAIARALARRTPVLVADVAIEQLARDVEPEVRALAAVAAGAHLPEDPSTYRRLLAELTEDAVASVREAAVSELRAASMG